MKFCSALSSVFVLGLNTWIETLTRYQNCYATRYNSACQYDGLDRNLYKMARLLAVYDGDCSMKVTNPV